MAENKRYFPGNRRSDLRLTDGKGNPRKFSDARRAWVTTSSGQFVILVGNESGESGNDVILYHPRPGKILDVSISLTNLTVQELDAMKDLIDSAFNWARPVCQQRDQEAQDAFKAGDDTVTRVYRAVPQLVYRPGTFVQHDEELLQRPEGVPQGSGGGVDSSGGVRGAGDELAEPDSQSGGAQDDRPSTDEP